jgi:hypothetical protein
MRMELEAQICKKNEEKIGAGKNNTGEKKEEPLKEFVPHCFEEGPVSSMGVNNFFSNFFCYHF